MLTPHERLTMPQVRALLGSRQEDGRQLGRATLYRWYKTGLRGVKLRTELQGGVRFTCRDWIDEFFTAVQMKYDGEAVPHAAR